MNHPITTQTLARIHQTELLKDVETNRLLRQAQATRPMLVRPWLTAVLLTAAGALFLLAG